MKSDPLIELLDKLYFHELAVREKLITRIQLIFTLHASFVAVIAFMCKGLSYAQDWKIIAIFFVILGCAAFLMVISIRYAYDAITGYKYSQLPDSIDIVDYREKLVKYSGELEEYNKSHPNNIQQTYDPERQFDAHIIKKLANSADKNKQINEQRRKKIAGSLKSLWKAAFFVLVCGGYFIFFGLDSEKIINTSQERGTCFVKLNIDCKISEPQMSRRNTMPDDENTSNSDPKITPPPPPPPPPSEPEDTYSTEDFKPEVDSGKEVLNE